MDTVDRMEKLLLKPAECAEAIGVSRSRVYELISSGVIPSIRVASSVRVPVAALNQWIADQLIERTGTAAA